MILTGNNRLARSLVDQHNQQQIDAGLLTWDSLQVQPFGSWLNQLWQQSMGGTLYHWQHAWAGRRLLSSREEHWLWQQVIANSEAGPTLLHGNNMANLAANALRLMCQANLTVEQWDGWVSEDAHAFRGWLQQFESRCEQLGWLSTHWLPNAVTQLLETLGDKLELPTKIELRGFEEITPQQQSVLNALQNHGVEISHAATDAINNEAFQCACTDAVAEFEAAARWALPLAHNEQARIGIVVPKLAEQLPQLQAVLQRQLHPQSQYLQGLEQTLPFNVSLGPTLAEWPLIRTALDWLALVDVGLEYTDLGRLLGSRYLPDAEKELASRAQYDAQLREDGRTHWRLPTLVAQKPRKPSSSDTEVVAEEPEQSQNRRKSPPPRWQALIHAAQKWHVELKKGDQKQLPSQWLQASQALWKAVGWPGNTELSSQDFQLHSAWQPLCERLARMDAVTGPMRLHQWRQLLSSEANDARFQPQATQAPIQVMGLLEACGAEFDYLWVCGMSDAEWPTAAKPNPLLPLQWQRQHGLAGASAERELAYARRITQQLLGSAQQVVFSYALSDGDRHFQASPLIPQTPLPTPLSESALPPIAAAPVTMVQEQQWAALPRHDDEAVKNEAGDTKVQHDAGGTAVLQDQSACGFRAFARHRLAARELASPSFGIDPRIRGLLLHQALQTLWGQLRTQTQLLALDEPALEACIADHVLRASQDLKLDDGSQLAKLEHTVCQRLLQQWLAVDKARGSFTVIHREQRSQVDIGPLRLRVSADRIDELDDRSQIVIDYKTAKNLHSNQWLGDRPEQPQLPLYAVNLDQQNHHIAAVLYAQIIAGGSRYLGLTDRDDLGAKLKPQKDDDLSLAQTILDWRAELTRLAHDYADGKALVDPKNQNSCTYCDLHTLCRINAQTDGSATAEEIAE